MIVLVVGGIGVGKSAVMSLLEEFGANTVYADKLNRKLLEDRDYLELLSKTFDGVVVDGKLDKVKLRSLIVSNDDAREKLNSLAHPRIFSMIERETSSNGLYFVEIPLLSQCLNTVKYDKICAVTAPKDVRARRVVERDGVAFSDAMNIINIQAQEDSLVEIADFVINNDDDLNNLRLQTKSMFEQCKIG